MKSKKRYAQKTFFFILLFIFSFQLSARDYYQLKIYNLKDQAQEIRVDNYLKNAYLPALHRAGVKKVGVFKPIENEGSGKKIIVFIPLTSFDDLESIEKKLDKDSRYQAAGA